MQNIQEYEDTIKLVLYCNDKGKELLKVLFYHHFTAKNVPVSSVALAFMQIVQRCNKILLSALRPCFSPIDLIKT
jgi:hypothetical protein